jgi:hypothetical protein
MLGRKEERKFEEDWKLAQDPTVRILISLLYPCPYF